MKSLKEYILESSILEAKDDALTLHLKQLTSTASSKIKTIFVHPIDQLKYNEIVENYTQVATEDKKGTKWFIFVPDDTADFKPIAISLKNHTWRIPTDKELYTKTSSAMGKDVKKLIGEYDRGDDKLVTLVHYPTLLYFMNEYTKVSTPGTNGWYTFSIMSVSDVRKFSSISNQSMNVFSINPSTREYVFGWRKDIPAKTGEEICYWTWFSEAMWDVIHGVSYMHGMVGVWGKVYEYLTTVLLPVASVSVPKRSEWSELCVMDWGSFRPTDKKFLVHPETLALCPLDKTVGVDTSTSGIELEINALLKQRYPGGSISDELCDYIMKNYTKVERAGDSSKKWYKVYRRGNDSKYGSFMVCFDSEEWRNRTFDEFYGSGIVD
jgi:hypothetical protein